MSIVNRPWIVGITGASGAIYGVRLCKQLLQRGYDLHLVITDAGWRVLHEELGWDASHRLQSLEKELTEGPGTWTYYKIQDIGASIASGTFRTSGMVIVPCSMGSLSAIARAASENLLQRSADVVLKENRRLILVPRETPLHAVHLEHMLTLAKMGVKILPAMPAFYHAPQSMDELIDFVVGKILDSMGIDHDITKRWGE